jgi:hypothetical protein
MTLLSKGDRAASRLRGWTVPAMGSFLTGVLAILGACQSGRPPPAKSASEIEQPPLPSQSPADAAPGQERGAPVTSPGKTSEVEGVLAQARACAQRATGGLGVHGTALHFEKARIRSPADAQVAGERDGLSRLGPKYRVVSVPESPPMNERVPNGLNLLVNTATGACRIVRMR